MNIDYSSFDSFVNSTYGRTIGEGECWDYINLIWSYLGNKYWTYPPSDPTATNHGVKWGWLDNDARSANTISGIIQIPNLSDVERGDIVVISSGTYGHAGFAYAPASNNQLQMYSQNWQSNYVTLDNISMATFVGAFRYTGWQPTPPPPTYTKSHFKWILYARKLRDKRSGL